MKIAIAQTIIVEEIQSWIDYCKSNHIDYILVNPYDSDVVEKCIDCDVFMWHHSQDNYIDLLFAKQLLFAMQQAGKVVFPDFYSGWHFDDKLGQKYLMEAVGVPLIKSYAFYNKQDALEWAKKTEFPKVFKLRCGAASTNVKLVRSYDDCKKYINKAFGKGFPHYDGINVLKESLKQCDAVKIFKSLYRLFIKPKNSSFIKDEKGYVYFQDFMPGNTYDTRVVVIGGKYACAERRINRKGDFRASGSGQFSFDGVDEKIIAEAFKSAKKLKMQSVAFDFVYDDKQAPRIVEICFGFGVSGIKQSKGYYTDDMIWHECKEVPFFEWIIKAALNKL